MALSYALFEKFFLKDARIFTDLVKKSSYNTALVSYYPTQFHGFIFRGGIKGTN